MVESRCLLRATFFFSCFILSKTQDASDAGLFCVRSAAANGQTSVTFMRQKSSGAHSVYLTRWSQHSTLLGCEMHSDPSVVESYRALCETQQALDQEAFTRFNIHTVLAPNAPCVMVPQKSSAPARGEETVGKIRRKRFWLFPGTMWCGSGNRAHGYDHLGMFERADVCCREHDHCQHSIPALTMSYGVFNHHLFSISHCDCDQRFKQCLKRMNDSVSGTIGYTFFNVLQVPCFELQYVKRCTQMYWWGMCKRAEEGPYAVFRKPRPFDSPGSRLKHVHAGITSSEKQRLTNIRVKSQRKSSKLNPRCKSQDPPRGDTFQRRKKTGKGCKRQKNLKEISSLQVFTENPSRSMPIKTGPSESKAQMVKKEKSAKKKSRRKDLSGHTLNSHPNASFITPSTVPPSTQLLKFNEDSTTTVKSRTESLKSPKKNLKPCQCEPKQTVTFQRQCKICSKQENKSKTTVVPAEWNKNVSTIEEKAHKTRFLKHTTESPSQKTSSSHWTPVTHELPVSAKLRTTPSTHENDTRQEQLNPHVKWSNSSQGLLERFKHTEKSVEENSVLLKDNHLTCQSLKHLDDCKFKISPLQRKYNLHNTDFKTVYHCNCTSRLAAQIKSSDQQSSYRSCLLVDFVSPRCFTLPKENECAHEERCSEGFIKAPDLLEVLKKAEAKGKADMGFPARGRKRKIPVRLYKRCLRLQKEIDEMSKLR